MHLTLLAPELIWPEPDDQFTLGQLSSPNLDWLLAHASLLRQPRRAFETVLADACGLSEPPFGPLRLLGDGGEPTPGSHWLCADPVHLRFHHERIVLADAGAFELDLDEAQALAASLNETFADIGRFHVADARRWYLQLNTAVDHAVAPLSAVAGRRVDSELPTGDATLTRWLNEVQMFLHGHPVNERRQAAGQPAINSLWLWGGGKIGDRPRFSSGENQDLSPVFPESGYSDLWSDQPLAAGLAIATGTPLHPLPADGATFLAEAGQRPLLVLDQLLPRVLYEDGAGWRQALQQLDDNWFGPLKKALGSSVDRIDLLAPTVYGHLHYTLTGNERWKFWKTVRPLPAIAKELAGKTQA